VLISGRAPYEAIAASPGAIGYVPQAVGMIAGTVRENVAFGIPARWVNDDRVWAALEMAHLDEFLKQSRDGLETLVGERGLKFSGGQRQRLGIARALYTRPKLLVLDEATSALDAETEAAITDMLTRLSGSVTIVTIAHRLATVRSADQLLFLHEGRAEAFGTFDEVRAVAPSFDRQANLLGL
jgi:ABC-type multidrug transport system fused ATPase/permease subunit